MVTSTNNNSEEFKALIISGYTPPATNGSGLMMYNLLKYFPENSFAFLTETIDERPSLVQYRLPVPYYCYGNKLTSLSFDVSKGGFLPHLRKFIKNSPLAKLLSQFFYIPYLIRKIVIDGKLAIQKEKPTILIGYSDFGANLCATYILHKITKVPFALYMYDAYADNKLPFVFKMLAKILEPKLFKEAKHIFVMCDKLKEHYTVKYSRNDIHIIYNSLIDMNLSESKNKINETFTIAYIGNVYWAQINALHNLIKAVKELKDIPVLLTLYTSHTKAHLHELGVYEDENIHFTTCLPEEVPSVLSTIDLVFVGLSFETKHPILINTSSPGRLCDFLRSETPILVHAPKDSFLTMYAKKHDFAFVEEENNSHKLAQTIRTIINNPKEQKQKIENAQNIGKLNHSAEKEAKIYCSVLRGASNLSDY
jgi:glycosyltransferase involved in cell wall biosynthesis